MELPKAQLAVSEFRATNTTEITFKLSASAAAFFVYLETPILGTFSDNGFHLRGNVTVALSFRAPSLLDLSSFQRSLHASSLVDMY